LLSQESHHPAAAQTMLHIGRGTLKIKDRH